MALSRSHDLLTKGKWGGATLSDLVLAQLEAFASRNAVSVDGPSVFLSPGAVQYLGMAFHELATNAAKYGALRSQDGRIEVSWRIASAGEPGEPRLQLTWRELTRRKAAPEKSPGFGSTVLERVAPAAVNGIGRIEFGAGGLTWTLDAPMASVEARNSDLPPI